MLISKIYIYFVFICLLTGLLIADDKEFLSNAEIYKIMQESKTSYSIKTTEQLEDTSFENFGEVYFPRLKEHLEYPLRIENSDSLIYLKSFTFDSSAWLELLNGEKYFKKKQYAVALDFYETAISLSESLYVAYMHVGDCYLFSDDITKALEYYKIASELNPFDYRAYYYCGTAYMKLNEYENAKESYLNALTLKPRHNNIMNTLSVIYDKPKIKVNTQTFEPMALSRMEGEEVAIYIPGGDDAVWMAYAFVKAIWLGEPSIRVKMTNDINNTWNSQIEKQAVFSLLEHYYNLTHDEKIKKNEYLDLIITIMEDGYFHEFIIYEIASKMYPDIIIQMPINFQERIKEYIKRYVIVDI